MRPSTAIAVALAALAATPTAQAAVTCDHDGVTHVLTITVTQGSPALVIREGTAIEVREASTPKTCSGPAATTTTIRTIVFDDDTTSSGNPWPEIALTGGPFEPGFGDEEGDLDEIEFELKDFEGLHVTGGGGDDDIIMGASGINFNWGVEGSASDLDLTFDDVANITGVQISGGNGDDRLDANGGLATGSEAPYPAILNGNNGPDLLVGGDAADQLGMLEQGAGPDELDGARGNDLMHGGLEDDIIDGGGGVDTAHFGLAAAVTVDLAIFEEEQDTGAGNDLLDSIENVTGSPGNDVILGNADMNVLQGQGGDDRLDGRGGQDSLFGGAGGDLLTLTDGGPDAATCGADPDLVSADAPGVDAIASDCESVSFPAGPGGGGSGGPGGGSGTGPAALLQRLALGPTAFRAARRGGSVGAAAPVGTRVSMTLSTAARVAFRVERARAGRRSRGRCRARGRGRRCVRWVRLKGGFAVDSPQGTSAFRFTGRLRGRSLRPGAYRLVATPTGPSGSRGPARRARFRITRR